MYLFNSKLDLWLFGNRLFIISVLRFQVRCCFLSSCFGYFDVLVLFRGCVACLCVCVCCRFGFDLGFGLLFVGVVSSS